MKLHIEADPDQGPPPLLLVHGILSKRNHWLPNRSLSERFRVIRVDLPAHGPFLSAKGRDRRHARGLVDHRSCPQAVATQQMVYLRARASERL